MILGNCCSRILWLFPFHARCFFIAQSYVLVKKWSEALVLYDRVLKYANEVNSDAGAFRNSLKVRLCSLPASPGKLCSKASSGPSSLASCGCRAALSAPGLRWTQGLRREAFPPVKIYLKYWSQIQLCVLVTWEDF